MNYVNKLLCKESRSFSRVRDACVKTEQLKLNAHHWDHVGSICSATDFSRLRRL
jgi:hypothetical protein